MMVNLIQVRLGINPDNGLRIIVLGYSLIGISMFSMHHLDTLQTSRESLIHSRMPTAEVGGLFESCSTPYDDNRCSVQLISNNHSENCLTDIEAMTGHILPLVSFVMQVCLIRELFVLRGNYSHILVNILWLVSLFTFIIVIVAAHGSTCYNVYAIGITFLTGCLLGGYVGYLMIRGARKYAFYENHIIFEEETVVATSHD